MKFLVAAASLIAAVQALTINTPASLTVCQPSLLSWADGSTPYFLTILPGGQTSGALKTFDQTDATSITWNVDLASGTSVTLSIKDGTGNVAYTDAVTITEGNDNSCVSSGTAASGSTGSATGSSGSSATSGGGSASTTGGSSSGSGSGSSASATSSAESSGDSNAANARSFAAPASLAGVLGLVGAALF